MLHLNQFMKIETILAKTIALGLKSLFDLDFPLEQISFQKTKSEFSGDITLVVFPFVKAAKLSPELTGKKLGEWLLNEVNEIESFNVVKGFLNLEIKAAYWINFLSEVKNNSTYGLKKADGSSPVRMVEYCGPNTNKPLHLGHIRNCLLGYSICEILKANGNHVIKVNIVNDRGIHICKSMLAWKKYGNGETPENTGIKGDHLVGKYYVIFDKYYKKEIEVSIAQGTTKEEAERSAPLMLEVKQMLRDWEDGKEEVLQLWKMMNTWVYAGFDVTYKKIGVDFDKIYFESETYLFGKKIIEEGLAKGVLKQRADNSVFIDLTADGLDEKTLLRGDGTSVYITQDIGTAVLRANDYPFSHLTYVVANEQDYHFKVLFLILKKLGYKWADGLFHLSYGMVELPEGKMKSREGTVVDADDLMDEMILTAEKTTKELGKIEDFTSEEAKKLYTTIGLGALKYFMLKVDPKKKMLFNPSESIDFNGNTGPFIQYTYARIKSILRKAGEFSNQQVLAPSQINSKEKDLIKWLYDFEFVINQAGETQSPSLIANYVYELVKLYNSFYHDCNILKEENEAIKNFRLDLSYLTSGVIKNSMKMLGIEVPERM
jgi:arginyl-tRNA synthetase